MKFSNGNVPWYQETDGVGATANFCTPRQVAVDTSGTVYVTGDCSYGSVRKITSAGVVSTLRLSSNDGGISSLYLTSIQVDGNGNIFSASSPNTIEGGFTILKVSPTGEAVTFAGSGQVGDADGPGAQASFTNISDIALGSNGLLYVSERPGSCSTLNNVTRCTGAKIRKITPN